MEKQAPIAAISRLRMQTDGQGITTLVCFHGCPLRCKWCINPFTWDPAAKITVMSPEQLLEKVRLDGLYFLATGGGITFGGGEPLLYSDFICGFGQIIPKSWHLCAETSLAVPWENIRRAAEVIEVFYVDVKDMNPGIYRDYTGKDNAQVLENLRKLLTLVGADRVVVRLPRIPEFNSEADRQRSRQLLAELGVTQLDLFTYRKQE